MIDYETYCKIVQMHRDGLRVCQAPLRSDPNCFATSGRPGALFAMGNRPCLETPCCSQTLHHRGRPCCIAHLNPKRGVPVWGTTP